MKNILRALLLLPFGLLAGCCANNACNCNDLFADALYFTLDPKSFTASDVDTVKLLRYSNTNAALPLDSATLIKGRRRDPTIGRRLIELGIDTTATYVYVISNNYPLPPAATGGKLSQYTYAFRIYQGDSLRIVRNGVSRPRSIYTLPIGHAILEGKYEADGCCTCYQNTKKAVFINGRLRDVTETVDRPVSLIVLSR